ncbi:hypothetical protein [Dactylosporangium sp. NPDC048998]|uniref:hypothetical protein n=1 Tax=Dactylosporangium sp. NPDC048998 TaxID=3363976 RepID=UPI00371848F3
MRWWPRNRTRYADHAQPGFLACWATARIAADVLAKDVSVIMNADWNAAAPPRSQSNLSHAAEGPPSLCYGCPYRSAMGMYPMYKEIPATLLARLLEHPDDEKWVDGLLFEALDPDSDTAPDWSAAASYSTLTDEELRARFTWPRLTFTAGQRRRLGWYDLGKYPDPDWFGHFLFAADTPQRIDLTGVLSDSGDWDERTAAWEKIAEAPIQVAHHSAYHEGDSEYAFGSDVPCYGINGYRTAGDLAIMWDKIERVLAAYPELADSIIEKFDHEIRYYYGCVARGSVDLYVVW